MEVNELLAEAVIGKDAEEFLNTDLGRVMVGRAQQELEAAMVALVDVDPSDVKTIIQLQNKAKRALNFGAWIEELITGGTQAMQVLQKEEE